MKEELVKIQCVNDNAAHEVMLGSSLLEIAQQINPQTARRPIAAYVDNEVKALTYRIFKPHQVQFIDITHFEGSRVYQRTLFMVLHKAVADLFPGCRLSVKHSVSKGFYCEIIGRKDVFPDDVIAIKRRADQIIAEDMPIITQ